MPLQDLTTPPTPPSRNDPPEVFIERADAFVAWQAQFATEMNTLATQLEATAALIAVAPAYADPGLLALTGNTPAADRVPYYNAADGSALAILTAAGRALLDDASASDQLTTLGLSANGKSLVTAADYAAMRTALSLVPGANVQAYDADLAAIAALTTTSYGRGLLELANSAALAASLGLTVSGTASSGKFSIAGLITLTWRSHNFTGTTTTAYNYGDDHNFTTWARAWVEGDDGTGDVSMNVVSSATTSATIRNNGSLTGGTLFAIGD